MTDNSFAAIRAGIERRTRKQLERHLRIDPNGNPKSIVRIQMKQEEEKLQKMAQEYAEAGDDNLAEVCELLVECLPEIESELLR